MCEEIVSLATCQIMCRRLTSHGEGQWMPEMSNRSKGAKEKLKEGEKEGVKLVPMA